MNVFDESLQVSQTGDRERTIHKERRWLGTLTIPFPTLYENGCKLEGRFLLETPVAYIGYQPGRLGGGGETELAKPKSLRAELANLLSPSKRSTLQQRRAVMTSRGVEQSFADSQNSRLQQQQSGQQMAMSMQNQFPPEQDHFFDQYQRNNAAAPPPAQPASLQRFSRNNGRQPSALEASYPQQGAQPFGNNVFGQPSAQFLAPQQSRQDYYNSNNFEGRHMASAPSEEDSSSHRGDVEMGEMEICPRVEGSHRMDPPLSTPPEGLPEPVFVYASITCDRKLPERCLNHFH